MLDAHETMARFVVDGQPDRELFEAAVGRCLRALRARRPRGRARVRRDGRRDVGSGAFRAAIRLEELWNELLRDGGFRLFCAYPIDVCGDGFTPADVDAVHVVRTRTSCRAERSSSPRSSARCRTCSAGRASALQPLIDMQYRPTWAALPRAEATILWLRDNVPNLTGPILTRTREYALLR